MYLPKALLYNRTILQELSLACIFLTISILIYWLFRGIPFIGVEQVFKLEDRNTVVLSTISYNLPDGLWLYALLTALKAIWKDTLLTSGKYWLWSICVLVPCTELLQAYKIISGTFDLLDITAYLLAIAIFIIPLLSPKHITI